VREGIVTSIRLYRVIVPVGDLERAVAFYRELLGQEGMRISPGRHYFGSGGVVVALYNPAADGDTPQVRANSEHIYFATDDLPAVFERAKRTGGLSAATGDGDLPMGAIARRPWGERSFYMHDPDGNPLCFVDQATLFTAGLG
jgi:catechol 2,3-dioxygenase-like lactoylglutathione lyase family enzyme